MDSSGTLVANSLNKFHNFHLFVLETTSEIYSAKYLFYNLKKPVKIVKIKDGLIMNSFIGISFLQNPSLDGCVRDTARQCN